MYHFFQQKKSNFFRNVMYFSVFSDQQEKIIGMKTKPAFKTSIFHLNRWYVSAISVDGNTTFCCVKVLGKYMKRVFCFVLLPHLLFCLATALVSNNIVVQRGKVFHNV